MSVKTIRVLQIELAGDTTEIEKALVKEDAALFELMAAMRAYGEHWHTTAPKMQTLRERVAKLQN